MSRRRSHCIEPDCSIRDDDDDDYDQASSTLPPKQILELVLDTLQRRDTYEMFAEPADLGGAEEDHCRIIKEPMDFGTMRAKLHEGMYRSLQQFEHDVFLIPENAMRFNSSNTLHFRQARALLESAKKVMNALKTDPAKFESEFSVTRRRSMRRALSDIKNHSSRASNVANYRNSKKIPPGSFSTRTTSTGRRASKSSSCNRRCTYRGPMPRSAVHDLIKSQLMMNEGSMNYGDSLLSYAKDLGSVAQIAVKRKLLEHQDLSCQKGSSSSAVVTIQDTQEGERKQKIDHCKTPTEQRKTSSSTKNIGSSSLSNKTTCFKDHNVRRPVILALETSHLNVEEFMSSNKNNSCNSVTATGSFGQQSKFIFDISFLKARMAQMNNACGASEVSFKQPLHDKREGRKDDASSVCFKTYYQKLSTPSMDKLEP